MISIGTDLGGLILQNTLTTNTLGLNHSIERMTTGYKINRAKDDAAGFAIAEGLSTKISSMIMVQQNVEEGIALLKTAEGALDNILGLLQRLRDLAEQAGNDVYGEDSRQALQAEADEIIKQIEQIKNTTEFNGLNLFEAPEPTTTKQTSGRPLGLSNAKVNIQNDSVQMGHSGAKGDSAASVPSFTSILDDVDEEIKDLSSSIKSNTYSNVIQKSPAPRKVDIEGAIDVAGGATKVVTIDGVDYTVRNKSSAEQTFSYTKDTTTGEVTFLSNNFEIKGQLDVAHNIIVAGSSNVIYGGDLSDTIKTILAAEGNYIYGKNGDDVLTNSINKSNYLSGDAGNDNISTYAGNANGGDDDDTINIKSGNAYGNDGNDVIISKGGNVYGGSGNDTITSSGAKQQILGDDGDDEFIISGSNNYVNGGTGNNLITDNGTNTQKINVPGANLFELVFTANQTITKNINGIDYTIKNNKNSTNTLLYKIESTGAINFYKGDNFTITGDVNKQHNVIMDITSSTFRGGNLSDTITSLTGSNYIYAGSGNDSITVAGGARVFGEDGDDQILSQAGWGVFIHGGNGNDSITQLSSGEGYIWGDSGNDTIVTTGNVYGMYLDGGDDDDNFSISSGSRNISIYGGIGNNSIVDNGINNLKAGFSASVDNASALLINPGETKNLTLGSIDYSIKSNFSERYNFLYDYNNVTGETSLSGLKTEITGNSNVAYNVNMYGHQLTLNTKDYDDTINMFGYNSNVYSNAGDDYITINDYNNHAWCGDGNDEVLLQNYIDARCAVYGEDGNDIITTKTGNYANLQGGRGNDTYNLDATAKVLDIGGDNIYNINVNNSNISGSSGNDTFYVNGDNNTILGQGGDDYYVIDGNNNINDGGTGNNYFVDNGTGNSYTNVTRDPNSGMLRFTYQGETKTFTLNGKTYTVTNDFAGTNTLTYSLNPNTGVITLDGSNLTTNAESDESAILNIRGDNNKINGSNLSDKITVEQGSNNIINGLDGNDTLIMNSDNNSLLGGLGNDTITLNGSTTELVDSGAGNDVLNINSGNNTNIDSGIGDDKLNIKGDSNKINANEGNNIILNSANNNTITAGSGNNKITVDGSSNIITAGDGNNILGVQGNDNKLTINKLEGTINIIGNKNNLTNTNGDNTIVIKGDENTYSTTNGDKEISVVGNGNNLSTGIGNDLFEIKGDNNILSSTDGKNEIDIKGNGNNYTGGLGVDDIKIKGDSNRAEGGDSNDSFMISDGRNNYIDGNVGDRNTMINNGVNTEYHNILDITPRPFELNLKVDIGSGQYTTIHTEISFNLFDFSVDFSTSEDARDALDDIDDLIDAVNKQLSSLGATINRLEGVSDAQIVKINNLTSSLSTIKDADIAEESSNFIRYQILQNATATLLSASRNLRGEMVLGILGNVNTK